MLWAVLYHDMSQDSVITIMIVNIFETIAQLYLLAMHYLSVVIVAIVLATALDSESHVTMQQSIVACFIPPSSTKRFSTVITTYIVVTISSAK